MAMEADAAYWSRYYDEVHRQGQPWLDYSNARVQAQTLALSLEASGPLHGRSCLDVGCGHGQFALMAAAQGAGPITGIELVDGTVVKLRQDHPRHTWIAGNAGDAAIYSGIQLVDVVAALEVLQYVPFAANVMRLWSLVRPGGRLVIVIPNAECPIVAKPMQRFSGHYHAVAAAEIVTTFAALPDLAGWMYRGLAFSDNQVVAPYRASPWTTAAEWIAPPNRFQAVAVRQESA